MLHSIYDACLRRCSIAAIVPLLAVFLASPVAEAAPSQDARVPVEQPPDGTTVLRTTRILDGTGNVLEDRDVVVRDGRIAEIVTGGSTRGDRVYNLTGLTVLPGYIDTHVHLSRHFDPNGRLHSPADRSAVGQVTLYGAENADRTLISEVTMVQSLGAADNADSKHGPPAARSPARACCHRSARCRRTPVPRTESASSSAGERRRAPTS